MKLEFVKMHGAGNDFVMLDDRAGRIPWQDHLRMAALAARRTGVGCEGVILIQKSDRADFRMRFLNPDGTEAEMCGNGARCLAAFIHRAILVTQAMVLQTMMGSVPVRFESALAALLNDWCSHFSVSGDVMRDMTVVASERKFKAKEKKAKPAKTAAAAS